MNAKEELLNNLKEINKELHQIKWAKMQKGGNYLGEDIEYYILKENSTIKEINSFIDSLDFYYDAGYGGQELFGLVVFKDNTWLERGEYDGSEWWDYCKIPEIPNECKR